MAPMALNVAQVDFFSENGYLLVPQLLNSDELAHVKAYYQRASEVHAAAVKEKDNTVWDQDANLAAVLRRAPAPFANDPAFRSIFSSSRILDHVEDLMGPDIYLHSSKLIFKPAHSGRRKPMHQDQAYWTDMSARQITLWVAIDRAAGEEGGGIELIPGSHKTLLPHQDLDDYQVREDELDLSQVCTLVTEPGDALFLDVLTVHATAHNSSDHDRLAAVVNYYSQPKSDTQTSRYGSTEPLRRSATAAS